MSHEIIRILKFLMPILMSLDHKYYVKYLMEPYIKVNQYLSL
jgi:hypothetical protein